jgi:hypothetical protein
MMKKTLFALGVAAVLALSPTVASAQRFHGGWHGGGWHGGGWRGGGWGWGAPAIGLGIGLGLASAAAWGPGWGAPGYAAWDGGCTRWRRVWTGWGWRVAPVNVCW